MARRHPQPTGSVEVPTYRDLDPVLSVGGVAEYFGVQKQLVARWAKRDDWPEPFATPATGALYLTVHVIEWGKANERGREAGPRETHDPRPPSVQRPRSKRASRSGS